MLQYFGFFIVQIGITSDFLFYFLLVLLFGEFWDGRN